MVRVCECILLKFLSDVSLRSIPLISAPKAPDNNFTSMYIFVFNYFLSLFENCKLSNQKLVIDKVVSSEKFSFTYKPIVKTELESEKESAPATDTIISPGAIKLAAPI